MYKTNEMPKRYPIDGTFELTIRCNLHCKMCLFRHDDSENADIIANELSSTQWIDLAKQVAEAGTGNLLITGGEPMLRSDFCEIWEGIYKQGFIITLYTNATLVTPKIMETLKKYPPHRIGITIYGSNPETYEKVCGQANAFYKAMEGVKQLQQLPSMIKFRTTIIKDNYDDVKKIEILLEKKFGMHEPLQQTRSVLPSVRGGCSKVQEVRLSPKENVILFFRRGIDEIKEIVGKDKFDINNIKINKVTNEKEIVRRERYTLLGCNAGMNSYTITYNGKLLGCQLLDIFSVDITENGFIKAWDEFPYHVKLPPLNEKCSNCNMVNHCETCYAARYAETGDLGGLGEYQCSDAQEMLKIYKGEINI